MRPDAGKRQEGRFSVCTLVQVSRRGWSGSPCLRCLDEPSADGDPGRFGTVLGFQLGEDRADVELDRSFRDKESTCDLGVLQAAGEEREHLEFPGCEAAVRRDVLLTLYTLEEPVCDGWLEEGPSGLDGADGAEDLLSGRTLEQVTAGARA